MKADQRRSLPGLALMNKMSIVILVTKLKVFIAAKLRHLYHKIDRGHSAPALENRTKVAPINRKSSGSFQYRTCTYGLMEYSSISMAHIVDAARTLSQSMPYVECRYSRLADGIDDIRL